VFPDIDRVSDLAKKIGLDSVLKMDLFNMGGIGDQLNAGNLLNLAGEILEKTNVINKTNKYVQSQKHLRMLMARPLPSFEGSLSVDAVFNRAYQFHKIDTYAELLGGNAIN